MQKERHETHALLAGQKFPHPQERRKKVIVISAVFNSEDYPKCFKTASGNTYYFPVDIQLNGLQKVQLLKLLKSKSPISVNYYLLQEERRVTKLENFTFDSEEEYYSAGDETTTTTSSSEKDVLGNQKKHSIRFIEPVRMKISLSVLSLSKGLLYTNEIEITSVEKLTQFFTEKTDGTAKICSMVAVKEKSRSNSLPQYYVIISFDFLNFSVPDTI